MNDSSAYTVLFVAKILPNRPVHSKGLRTRVYARTRVRFFKNFVSPVLFGHNLGPLDQKKHPKKFSCRLGKSTSIRAIDLAVQHIQIPSTYFPRWRAEAE